MYLFWVFIYSCARILIKSLNQQKHYCCIKKVRKFLKTFLLNGKKHFWIFMLLFFIFFSCFFFGESLICIESRQGNVNTFRILSCLLFRSILPPSTSFSFWCDDCGLTWLLWRYFLLIKKPNCSLQNSPEFHFLY